MCIRIDMLLCILWSGTDTETRTASQPFRNWNDICYVILSYISVSTVAPDDDDDASNAIAIRLIYKICCPPFQCRCYAPQIQSIDVLQFSSLFNIFPSSQSMSICDCYCFSFILQFNCESVCSFCYTVLWKLGALHAHAAHQVWRTGHSSSNQLATSASIHIE